MNQEPTLTPNASTRRPSASSARSIRRAIHADLAAAYPHPVATHDLIERHGVAVKSRMQELDAKDGEDVESVTLPDGRPGYRLRSLDRKARRTIHAGCILRLDSREGWAVRTHTEATLPEDVLAEAEEAASDAYRAVLRARGYGNLLDASACPSEPPAGGGQDDYAGAFDGPTVQNLNEGPDLYDGFDDDVRGGEPRWIGEVVDLEDCY